MSSFSGEVEPRRLERRLAGIDAVTFDATGTLFHTPRLGEIYAEVLARHGVRAEAAELVRLIRTVWRELECKVRLGEDRFAAHPGGARGFWSRLLERVCELLGEPAPSKFAAAELYAAFGRAAAWKVYPEVPAVLTALAASGRKLAVVANWDERLPDLVAELGLGRWLSAVVTSQEVGTEKPDPRIFRAALERLGGVPERALHVGDRIRLDVEGAIAAGMSACHLDRRRRRGDGEPALPPELGTPVVLADLGELVGLPAVPAAAPLLS